MTEKSLVNLNIPIKIRQQYFIFILETNTCLNYKYGTNGFLFFFSFCGSIKIRPFLPMNYVSFFSDLNVFIFEFSVCQDGVPSSLYQVFFIVIFSVTLDNLPLG